MYKSLLLAAVAPLAFVAVASADPVSDKLVIDGQEIITRAAAAPGMPFDEVRSGWLYREPETRELQMDSFENPGMLAVERGAEIWGTPEGAAGKSCADCHGDAAESMKGVGASFPKWNAKVGKPFNVELQVNDCRVNQMKAEPYKFDETDQKAMTTFIKHQSHGQPLAIDLGAGEMQSWWQKGHDLYYTRTGQLNLACANCHEAYNGKFIRADHLSQGQVNGFPTYRLKDGLVSLHDRFRGCIRDTRGAQPAAFSDELMALEVYTTWRATGLAVETPSVRQ